VYKNFKRWAMLTGLALYNHVGFANDLSQYFGGGLLQPARFCTTSQTVTIPVSGTYRVSLVGAGGSGGCAKNGTASGGGGGGFVEDDAYIMAGTTINITLGTGGQPCHALPTPTIRLRLCTAASEMPVVRRQSPGEISLSQPWVAVLVRGAILAIL